MNIAICDDEKAQRDALYESLITYFKQKEIPVRIDQFENASRFLFHNEEHSYDIVLLDIQMEGMNGMELGTRIRTQQEHTAIIFVTGLTDYIYESFEIQAINYLLKPYDESRLFACLDKALLSLNQQDDFLALVIDKELMRINEKLILHVMSEGHYLNIVVKEQIYRIKMSMKEIELALQGKQFYKIGRSDLINLDEVDKITSKEIVLSNQTRIPIPKGKHKEITQAYMNHHFRGLSAC